MDVNSGGPHLPEEASLACLSGRRSGQVGGGCSMLAQGKVGGEHRPPAFPLQPGAEAEWTWGWAGTLLEPCSVRSRRSAVFSGLNI